ncbi:MAG: cellulase [Pseudomonadaceae bacterium]|nr:cellulase [Pseudomonadaceae bacterium]
MALLCLTNLSHADVCASASWNDWNTFAERYVQADGRVLGSSLQADHSTSEGQSYALFFALVANDQARFEKIWRWTVDNLSAGDPGKQLPAWLWGRAADGVWRVQDANSASDSDLWLTYALLEAARLWQRADYQTDAQRLLANIKASEVVSLPGLGQMLLPGPLGFVHADHMWRLNPSYMPVPLLRRLDHQDPTGPWGEIAKNTATLLQQATPKGLVADWLGYRGTSPETGIFVLDPEKGDIGSYDAIRVYLWAGMTSASDPLAAQVLASLYGMAPASGSTGVPPEKVNVLSGSTQGGGPFGFSAALIPYFQAKGQPWLAQIVEQKARQSMAKAFTERAPEYYNYMLGLFGLGWADQRYRFLDDGRVKLFWESACSDITH